MGAEGWRGGGGAVGGGVFEEVEVVLRFGIDHLGAGLQLEQEAL